MSIEDLIDIHSPFVKRFDDSRVYDFPGNTDSEEPKRPTKFRSKAYMDNFINPPGRYPDIKCQSILTEIHRFKELFEQDFSGM